MRNRGGETGENGKRPTKREKMHMNSYSLNPENWSIYKKRMDDYIWFIVIRTQDESFQVRRVDKHHQIRGGTYMNQLKGANEQSLHNDLVFENNGEVVTDSLTIAEMFGKRHDNVLSDIKLQMEYAGEKFSL